jgi:hypothetical protein
LRLNLKNTAMSEPEAWQVMHAAVGVTVYRPCEL